MQDDQPSQEIQSQPEQKGLDTEFAVAPLTPNQPNTANAQAVSGKKVKSNVKSLKDRFNAAEKWMIILTGVIAFSALCQVGASLMQWRAMKGQLKEIRSGSVDIKASTKASRDFADSAEKINTGVGNAVDKLNLQAGELQRSVEQANRLATATEKTAQAAKDGIETNRDALVLENRAWLGVVGEIITQLEAGKELKAEVTVINSGKTPASQVMEGFDIEVLPTIPTTPILFGLKPTAAIPPQGTHILRFVSKTKLSGIEMGKITDKTLFLVFRGVIQYEDFNNVQRYTNICMYVSDPVTKQLIFCETGNEMD